MRHQNKQINKVIGANILVKTGINQHLYKSYTNKYLVINKKNRLI